MIRDIGIGLRRISAIIPKRNLATASVPNVLKNSIPNLIFMKSEIEAGGMPFGFWLQSGILDINIGRDLLSGA